FAVDHHDEWTGRRAQLDDATSSLDHLFGQFLRHLPTCLLVIRTRVAILFQFEIIGTGRAYLAILASRSKRIMLARMGIGWVSSARAGRGRGAVLPWTHAPRRLCGIYWGDGPPAETQEWRGSRASRRGSR